MAKKWYYLHDGQTKGPVRSSELQRLALAGELSPQDLIWPASAGQDAAVEAQSALLFPVELTAPAEAPPEPVAVEPAPEKKEEPAAPPTPQPTLPDWLEDVRASEQRVRSRPASEPDLVLQPGASGVPDWLQDLLGTPIAPEPAPPEPAPAAVEPPPPEPAPEPPAPEPPPEPPVVEAAQEPTPVANETGIDPETGRVLDSDKFQLWLAEQNFQRKTRLALEPIPSLHDRLQEAKRAIEDWADHEANRDVVLRGDVEAARQDAALQEALRPYQDWGPEMMDKLWRHVRFIMDNRRRFYTQMPGS